MLTPLVSIGVLGLLGNAGRAEPPGVSVGEAEILTHAARHAPAVHVARAELALGDAAVERADALLPEDPLLTLSAGPRLAAETSLDWEIALEQRLEIAGERGLRQRAARASHARRVAELRRVGWRVHRQVHRAFCLALLAKRRLEVQRQLQDFAVQLLELARRRQAAGDIAELQVSLVVGELALARQGSVRAAGHYRAARLELARHAGWSGPPPEPAGPLEQPRVISGVKRLVGEIARRHPDLVALRAAVEERRAEEALARRQVAPSPVLGVSVAREAEGHEVNTIVLGTVGLQLPLWQRNRGDRAETRARLRVARARHRAAQQQLRARLLAAVEQISSAARRVAIFGSEVLPSFGRNLDLLRRAFEEGKIDAVQVMVARGRLLATQVEALAAYDDYFNARAELELALGEEIPRQPTKEHRHE